MIDSTFHVTLNGIKYKLGGSEQGDHYIQSAETLRPPNAVVVQGEGSNQKFQVRPDVLLWHWTDWSGGEGANKYDFRATSRANQLTGVSVFDKPGNLKPGWYIEDTQLHTAGGDLAKSVVLVNALSGLAAVDMNAVDAWTWNPTTNVWDDATISGPSAGAEGQAAGDDVFMYFVEDNTRKLWKWPTSGAATEIDDAGSHTDTQYVAELGANCYVYSPADGELLEVPKSGSASTVLESSGIVGDTPSGGCILEMNGKIYFMVAGTRRTRLHETIPSTAAGAGFVSVLATLEGFRGESMWSHQGTLYIAGTQNSINSLHRAVMYVTPGGDWGSIGSVRDGDGLLNMTGQVGNSRLLSHYFMTQQRGASATGQTLWEIDSVTGGIAAIAYNEDGNAKILQPSQVQVFDDQIFFSGIKAAATKRIGRAYSTGFHQTAEAISPWHDFDLADEKILSSLVVSFSSLPADWTVNVDYATNGSVSWTTVITDAVDGSVGGRTAVSTDSATVKFRRVRLRIRITYTGSGVPSSAPEVYGVEARAQVAKPQDNWVLLLDLNDDHGSAQSSKAGAAKIANIKTATTAEKVVAFIDGYEDRQAGKSTEYDVVIDSFRMILDRPGEGYVQVRLHGVA